MGTIGIATTLFRVRAQKFFLLWASFWKQCVLDDKFPIEESIDVPM
jgi:hypothetical protein